MLQKGELILKNKLAMHREKTVKGIRRRTAPGLGYQTKIQFIEKRIDRSLRFFGDHHCIKDAIVQNIKKAALANPGGKQPDAGGQLGRALTGQIKEEQEQEDEAEPNTSIRNSARASNNREAKKRKARSLSASGSSEMSLEDDLELERLRQAIEESKNVLEVQRAFLEQEQVKYNKLRLF